MGRLAGFSYRKITKKLRKLGFSFKRESAGSHEVWANRATGRVAFVPRHNTDMPERTLRAILRDAGIGVDEFLDA